MNGGEFGDVFDRPGGRGPAPAARVHWLLYWQLGGWPERGAWVELRVAGPGHVLGRLQAWGVDRWGPWVQVDGDVFDVGDPGRPWRAWWYESWR